METVASIPYVGLDVHKGRIDIALAEPGLNSEVRHLAQISGPDTPISFASSCSATRFSDPREAICQCGANA